MRSYGSRSQDSYIESLSRLTEVLAAVLCRRNADFTHAREAAGRF